MSQMSETSLTLGSVYERENVNCAVMSDFATPCTVACQAPLSMEFSRQEYWSGLPFPPPENLPDQTQVSRIADTFFTG